MFQFSSLLTVPLSGVQTFYGFGPYAFALLPGYEYVKIYSHAQSARC